MNSTSGAYKHIKLSVLFLVAFGLPSIATADGKDATEALVSACMSKNVNIEICESAQAATNGIEKIAERMINQTGINPTYSAIVASSSQILAQGAVKVNTSIYGIKSKLEVSPKIVNVAFSWNF